MSWAGISSSFVRTLVASVVVSAAYPHIASPLELVQFPLSLAAFWIFIIGNVLLQLVRIYYNRVVLASFWNRDNSSALKTQLLEIGERNTSNLIETHYTAFSGLTSPVTVPSALADPARAVQMSNVTSQKPKQTRDRQRIVDSDLE
jgi:hypothetical protein